MQWWRQARFGMFIHWGLYSALGGIWKGRRVRFGPAEWIMCEKLIPKRSYRRIAADFNPVDFDADRIARLAKAAGMKYMVFTAKHHDGFSMFHSRLTRYNIVDATPFQRDPVAELAAACDRHGLRFGLYYSQLDWNWSAAPLAFAPIVKFADYLDFLMGQLEELLTHYGPVSTLFFDGDWMPQWTAKTGARVESLCRSLQPDVIINDRVGKRYLPEGVLIAGKPLTEHFPFLKKFDPGAGAGDYLTPEQYVPARGFPRDWETCMTMNGSWGYNSFDNNWKTVAQINAILADTISRGGNLLLNIGPDGKGNIPAMCEEILMEIGNWSAQDTGK
jgi:alpha-L-fucosidase